LCESETRSGALSRVLRRPLKVDLDAIYCDTKVLSRAFRRCHDLKSLWIKSGEYPFPDPTLSPIWENDFANLVPEKWDKRTSLSRLQDIQVAVIYHSSILMAVNASTLPISTLRMDCMPIACFVDPERERCTVSPQPPFNDERRGRKYSEYVGLFQRAVN